MISKVNNIKNITNNLIRPWYKIENLNSEKLYFGNIKIDGSSIYIIEVKIQGRFNMYFSHNVSCRTSLFSEWEDGTTVGQGSGKRYSGKIWDVTDSYYKRFYIESIDLNDPSEYD